MTAAPIIYTNQVTLTWPDHATFMDVLSFPG